MTGHPVGGERGHNAPIQGSAASTTASQLLPTGEQTAKLAMAGAARYWVPPWQTSPLLNK